MCEWCGEKTPEERRRLREAGQERATDLRRLATYYQSLGDGSVKAHDSTTIERTRPVARAMLRILFRDWF